MAISLGSNIGSLRAQRRLSSAQGAESTALERLASGSRIVRASDDAAGLAVASSLSARARVYSQGVRNISDGVSALSIADSALGELSSVTTRLKELAEQAANGTFSRTQRLALQKEADELTKEFNRTLSTTSFNGISLLSGASNALRIQAGFGISGGVSVQTSQQLAGRRGLGTFGESSNIGFAGNDIQSSDLNGDGKLDVATVDGSGLVLIRLGDGNGGFTGSASYAMGGTTAALAVADFTGDGIPDIATTESGTIRLRVGDGTGLFGSIRTLAVSGTSGAQVGDFNGDGKNDLFTMDVSTGVIRAITASSSGTLSVAGTYSTGITNASFSLADINGDGRKDILLSDSGNLRVLQATGNQSYTQTATLVGSSTAFVADLNRDGLMDIAVDDGTYLQNSDGSFGSKVTPNGASGMTVRAAADMNGDGLIDLLYDDNNGSESGLSLFLGNGSNGFQLSSTFSGGGIGFLTVGDFNGDGASDVLLGLFGSLYLQGTVSSTETSFLTLTTQADARNSLTSIDNLLQRLSQARGALGSGMSRLQTSLAVVREQRDTMEAAQGRITDADVALESGELVKSQIVKQVAASVMAQANTQPALALQLLRT
jgi:flagellin